MIPWSWLYVPGDHPRRIGKALAGEADAVVIDLEDAVAPSAKDAARQTTVDTLTAHRAYVRINPPESPHGARDLDGLAAAPGWLAGVRIPKCTDPAVVATVADTVGVAVFPIVESALGVENAFQLARAHPLVGGLVLGEADLAADLRVGDPQELDWPRSRIVVAARAAGLPSPPQSVWTAVRDLDGLRASSEAGRRAGFFGRSVIHPSQVPTVHEVFAPKAPEIRWAQELMDQLGERDGAVWIDADGRFVDPAIVERARWLLTIAGTQQTEEP